MAESLPALTIWQPWASMIIEGIKPFEFRRWCAPRHVWGRRIAIHAGARQVKPAEIRDLLKRIEYDGARGQALEAERAAELLTGVLRGEVQLPLASVLGTALLGTPLSPAEVRNRWANDSDRDAEFSWAWPMLRIQRMEPFVPAKGAQGFWPWTPPNG